MKRYKIKLLPIPNFPHFITLCLHESDKSMRKQTDTEDEIDPIGVWIGINRHCFTPRKEQETGQIHLSFESVTLRTIVHEVFHAVTHYAKLKKENIHKDAFQEKYADMSEYLFNRIHKHVA